MTPADERRIAEAATKGPWEWERPSEDDFPQHDQSLVTTWKEDDGHPVPVVFSWGYDASGTEAEPQDRLFIATFNPKRVLELLDENERLRDQNARLMAGNHTAAERQDWRKQFMDTHDDNLALRARLAAVEQLHHISYAADTQVCEECWTVWPCDTIKAARGE